MLRFLKQMAWLAGIAAGCQSAFGYALIGPTPAGGNPDDFQIQAIGYQNGTLHSTGVNALTPDYTASVVPVGDIGTPKAFDQGYRRNTPVMYYSFDASFFGFFGSQGEAEVDKALAVYNNLANVSAYSQDLSEFPTETRRVNYRAAAVSLQDVKSMAMGMMTEQLGFWQPVRWVWCLHGRLHLNGPGIPPCPGGMEYSIIKRNYDIVPSPNGVYQSSSYVNGVLYSYFIEEVCSGSPVLADAVEFPVDPLSDPYSAVADYTSFAYLGLQPGTFYTGLTRDDVGGLRALIRSNNIPIAPENSGVWTIEFETNGPAILTNQDLNLFTAQAATNPPAALLALYPGLIINTVSNNFVREITSTNITETLTNSPFDPAGAPPSHPLFTTNYTTNVVQVFYYTFANLFTNTFSTRGLVGSISLGLTNSPFAPAGTPPTIVTNTRLNFVNGSFGGFFLLPTNACQVQVLSNIFSQVIATTNLPATNALGGGGGIAGPTNAITFTPGTVSFFTQDTLVYLPITCPTNTPAFRQGVEKISFIRRDYDGVVGRFWKPVTNDYTLVEFDTATSTLLPRRMERVVLRPDFLYTAADLADGTDLTISNTIVSTNFTGSNILSESVNFGILPGVGEANTIRTTDYDETQRSGTLAGPGTIVSPFVLPTLFIFNEVGPFYINSSLAISILSTNLFFIQPTEGTQFAEPDTGISWGSFDGSTNTPTVYPNGTDGVANISQLENLLTGPFFVTASFPSATVGVNYSAAILATGGQPPYTISLSPGSPGLPDGLNLTTDSNGNWFITGTPTGPGGGTIFDFSIRLTDSAGAFKDQAFTITIF